MSPLPKNRYLRFLQTDEWHRGAEAARQLRKAGNPGRLRAAQLCFPPPARMWIATTLHALIFSIPFVFINPLLGIVWIMLVYAISFGYTWPRHIQRSIDMDPSGRN